MAVLPKHLSLPTLLDFPQTVLQFPSSSDDNEYIPVYLLSSGELFTFGSGKKRFLYSLTLPTSVQPARTMNFTRNLQESSSFVMWKSPLGVLPYFSTIGTVLYLDENDFNITPLMLLCVKQKELFNFSHTNSKETQLSLLVSNVFLFPAHKNVFRLVNRDYIEQVRETGIDIIYTNNINSLCFSTKLNPPKLATIDESLSYFSELNQQLKV